MGVHLIVILMLGLLHLITQAFDLDINFLHILYEVSPPNNLLVFAYHINLSVINKKNNKIHRNYVETMNLLLF